MNFLINKKLFENLNEKITIGKVLKGMNATADSFYSSQGILKKKIS